MGREGFKSMGFPRSDLGIGLVDRNNFFLIFRDDLVLGNRLDLTFDHELFGRENRFVLGGLVERADQIPQQRPARGDFGASLGDAGEARCRVRPEYRFSENRGDHRQYRGPVSGRCAFSFRERETGWRVASGAHIIPASPDRMQSRYLRYLRYARCSRTRRRRGFTSILRQGVSWIARPGPTVCSATYTTGCIPLTGGGFTPAARCGK